MSFAPFHLAPAHCILLGVALLFGTIACSDETSETGASETGGAAGNPSGGAAGDSSGGMLPASAGQAGAGGGAAGASSNAPDCSYDMATWEGCGLWDRTTFPGAIVRNNFWNSSIEGAGEQCVWAVSPRCWGVNATHANATGQVKGYPSMVRGWTYYDGYTTTDHGLGIPIADLTRAVIHWDMDAPDTGRFIGLWDIYLDDTPDPGSGQDVHPHTNLMLHQRLVDDSLWFDGQIGNLPTITLDGKEFRWRIFDEAQMSARYRVVQLFTAPAEGEVFGVETNTYDLKAILDGLAETPFPDATVGRDPNMLSPGLHLCGVQTGYEIIDGGTFVTRDNWVVVQDEPVP